MDPQDLAWTRKELERMLSLISDLEYAAEEQGEFVLAGGSLVSAVREAIVPTRRALNDLNKSRYSPTVPED